MDLQYRRFGDVGVGVDGGDGGGGGGVVVVGGGRGHPPKKKKKEEENPAPTMPFRRVSLGLAADGYRLVRSDERAQSRRPSKKKPFFCSLSLSLSFFCWSIDFFFFYRGRGSLPKTLRERERENEREWGGVGGRWGVGGGRVCVICQLIDWNIFGSGR